MRRIRFGFFWVGYDMGIGYSGMGLFLTARGGSLGWLPLVDVPLRYLATRTG